METKDLTVVYVVTGCAIAITALILAMIFMHSRNRHLVKRLERVTGYVSVLKPRQPCPS